MQFAVNFGPVLLNRCWKYCSWIGPKLLSSSSCYSSLSGAGQTVEGVVKWMGQHAPVFAVKGNEITVLHEPEQFFNSLKDNVRNAKERIVLASLYLGTGNKEQQLVDCIREAVRQSSSAKQSLNVEILLEHTRGSRGDHNSRTMLLPLVQNFTDTVKVSLYHSPSLRGLLKLLLPERFNETVALTHLKVYLTDNTLIMSGANLSADYFTNRQDRYIEIKNCAALADYFHGLVSTVRSFSFQLQPDNSTVMSKMFPLHPTQGFDRGKKFKVETGKTVLRYLSHQKDENSYNNSISQRKDDQCDTWIVPLVQMFPFGIRQDEFITSELLRSASHSSVICLASGYFNLTRKYIDIMLKSSAKFEILTAHPTVNGFYEAKGVAGGIPHAYTLLLYDFFKLILKHKLDHITVYEYACSGWTFHVKGLWYYLGNKHLPNLTLIGSPNFGHRSVYRDLEAQIAIVTKNQDLRRALHEEKSRLYYKAKCVSKETFELTERKTPFWVYCVTRMMKNFL